MMNYYVYVLLCSDRSYYTGVTNNLQVRIKEHHLGINPKCYTFKRRPVKCVFFQEFPTPIEALTAEKQIKGWSRRKKEALIRGDWKSIHESARCKNKTSHVFYKSSSLDSARDDKDFRSG